MGPVRAVAELIAPTRCLACRRRSSLPWCEACGAEVVELRGRCRRCAGGGGPGHACWPASSAVAATWAPFDYRGPVASAVVTAKLGGAHAGWWPLAALLADHVAADPPLDAEVVTWVTTPPARVRRRGIDHARVLATALAHRLDLPLVALLRPVRSGGHRVARDLPGTQVLLVDDVLTTGATATRTAGALLAAGAGRVELAVLGRAGTHPLVGSSDA